MTAIKNYQYEVISRSPSETLALGNYIGEKLEAAIIIALTGELGCGKTLLTRGICEGLGVPVRLVNSPTFVLVNEYRGRLPVFHLDVYRLGSEEEAVELGITDYFVRAESGVMIIEWAEKIRPLLPLNSLMIKFERLSARQRRITFSMTDKHAGHILKGLKQR